jgi:hypothetical protein
MGNVHQTTVSAPVAESEVTNILGPVFNSMYEGLMFRSASHGVLCGTCRSRINGRTYFVQFRPQPRLHWSSRAFRAGRGLTPRGRARVDDDVGAMQIENKGVAYQRLVQMVGDTSLDFVAALPPKPHVFLSLDARWIVTEHVDYELQPRGPGSTSTADVFDRLVQCAQQLHRVGILHMDICPDNIRLRRKGDVKTATLVDLGMCQRRTDGPKLLPGDPNVDETRIGHTHFMSIAQHRIDIPHVADDVESIAYVCLWHARGGTLPWQHLQDDLQVMRAKEAWLRETIQDQDAQHSSDIEFRLADVVRRAWRHGRLMAPDGSPASPLYALTRPVREGEHNKP